MEGGGLWDVVRHCVNCEFIKLVLILKKISLFQFSPSLILLFMRYYTHNYQLVSQLPA